MENTSDDIVDESLVVLQGGVAPLSLPLLLCLGKSTSKLYLHFYSCKASQPYFFQIQFKHGKRGKYIVCRLPVICVLFEGASGEDDGFQVGFSTCLSVFVMLRRSVPPGAGRLPLRVGAAVQAGGGAAARAALQRGHQQQSVQGGVRHAPDTPTSSSYPVSRYSTRLEGEMPCLNCRLIEMGEMACYAGRCSQCHRVPPCLAPAL